MLLDDAVIAEIGKRGRQAIRVTIGLGYEAVDVKPAELADDHVGICRARELDRDVRFEARHVSLLHRTTEFDSNPPIGLLEIDQSWQDPEIARAFSHGDADRALAVCGEREIGRA